MLGMAWLYGWGPGMFAAGLWTGTADRILLGGLIWCGIAGLYRPMTRFYGLPWLYAFALPITSLVYAAITFHSALLHLRGKTGLWKGRNYFESVARR